MLRGLPIQDPPGVASRLPPELVQRAAIRRPARQIPLHVPSPVRVAALRAVPRRPLGVQRRPGRVQHERAGRVEFDRPALPFLLDLPLLLVVGRPNLRTARGTLRI